MLRSLCDLPNTHFYFFGLKAWPVIVTIATNFTKSAANGSMNFELSDTLDAIYQKQVNTTDNAIQNFP